MQFRKKTIKTYPILTLAKEIEKKEKSRIFFQRDVFMNDALRL